MYVMIIRNCRCFDDTNDFNSDNYRYFVDESGNIFKYRNDLISTFCFAGSSTSYPKDEPFDLSRFIKMQDKITFNSDSYIQLSFQAGDHIIISDFLDSKLFSEKVVWQKLISGPNETFSEINTNKLKNYGTLMQPDERNEFLNSIIEPYNFMKTNQEKEVLKIADRISQEEALERYNDDTKHIDLANNEREALEYISSHKKAYCVAKRKNPSLTCIDFFNIEQGKQRKNCGYRLIKALKQRARSIS